MGEKHQRVLQLWNLCEAFLFFKFCIHSNSVHPCVVKVTSFGLYFGFPSRFGLSKCGVMFARIDVCVYEKCLHRYRVCMNHEKLMRHGTK